MSKKTELSVNSKKAYEMVKESENGLTIAEMKEMGFSEANSSHLTALKRRGLVDSVEIEIEVPTVIKRKVQKYFVVNEKEGE